MNDLAPTVFIVDDDPSVLKALARLMRSAGLNAITFASPQEFLDNYDQNASGCLCARCCDAPDQRSGASSDACCPGWRFASHFPHRSRRHSDECAGDKTGSS